MRASLSRFLLLSFVIGVGCFVCENATPKTCFAFNCNAITLQVDADELSDEEAKSIKIAERFFSILEKSPRRGTALDRVYGHHVEFGTLDDFLQTLTDRVKENPEDGTGWMLLGMFESHRGQDAEAADAFSNAEKFRNEDALPAYYLGQSLLLIGQPEKAVEAFERAIDRKPRRPDMLEIFRQLGRVHQRAQRTEEALEVWNRLEQLFPDDARVQEQIAITMVEEGEYALALPRYEKLATLVKDDYRRVVFNIEAAELKIRLNKKDDGVADLEKLLADLNPTGWLFRDVRRRIEDIFLRSGDQDGLVSYYEKWIGKNPEDIGAIARLARFLASSARVEEASEWMGKALALAPKRTDLRKAFIDQLVNDQRYAEASKQYAELVKTAPGNPDFLRDWGKLVMKDRNVEKEKRREQAVRIWSRIVEARPKDALTHAQVADLYRQSGLEKQAIERYENAIELAPDEPQYREYLGEYFHILKRSDEALKIWESIADGKRNTAENVARLAEVYNSFGYLPQAVEKIAIACKLEPKEFALQLRAAEYHMRHGKFAESLAYNAAANGLSASEEESELALKNRIEIFQTNRKLDEEIDRLRAEIESSETPTVDGWHTLARYLEADRNWADATAALEKALEIDAKSIPVLTSSARVAETSGDYGRAAAENRKLSTIDRRLRSEHLMNVARLEAQLGNREEALAAGKELLVSAPGNTDNYQFYSQLCYRLGETELALDTLRKAVRINPTEPSLTMALGRSLADEFRTDEAIEVYWRAFEKSEEIDDRTSLIQKLAGLYQQQNQFDKLIERLERDRREESKRREMTICIAQAYNSTGDYGTARRELESLLTDNTRDTNLLQQLSKLCESGSDLDAAVEYQTQLSKIAPGHESEFRLASLLYSNGKRDAASEIFVKLTAREEDPLRLLKSIDGLLQRSNFDSVVKITEPLLSESRDDWEMLYREGLALAKQEKFDEAKLRFERILKLNLPHDKMGVAAAAKFKRESQKARSDNNRGIQSQIPERVNPFQLAQSQASAAKSAVGLEQATNYGSRLPPLWTPSHFGVARMAAFAWLTRFESDAEFENELASSEEKDESKNVDDEDDEEVERTSFVDAYIEKGRSESADQNEIYDWLYIENLRGGFKEIFEISRRLAQSGGKPEQKFFLSSLATRGVDSKNVQNGQQQNLEDPEPLSEADIELMLKCYKAVSKKDDSFSAALGSGQVLFSGGRMYVRTANNSWRQVGQVEGSLGQVVKELKLAGKTELAESMINERVEGATKASQLVQAMLMLKSEKKDDRLDDFLGRWKAAALEEIELAPIKVTRRGTASNKNSPNQTAQILPLILKWTGPLAAEEENAKVLSVIGEVLDVEMKERIKKRKQAKASRRKSGNTQSQYYDNRIPFQYGDKPSSVRVDYPRAGNYISTTGIHMLRQAYEVLKKNDVEGDLLEMVRQRVKDAETEDPESLMYERMLLATVLFWQEEKDEAIEVYRSVSAQLKDDPEFQFEVASLYEKLGDLDESLNIIESIEPRQQKLVQRKETEVLRLAERLGDLDRARKAAERLFGLRLNSQTQLSLVANMKRLGMVEMADAVMSRAQRRGGQKIPAMISLMGLYQGQGKTDMATQVAHRILQRTRSSISQKSMNNRSRRYRSSNSDERNRNAAIATLQQAGALDPLIERLEAQQKRSPNSPGIYEQLIEFYIQTNNTEKLIPMLETAVEARPKSAFFRELLAKQYSKDGKNEEACEQYVAAIKENPMLLSGDYYQIKSFFKAAGRTSDLLDLFQKVNIREIGQPYYVADFASELLRESQQANTEGMTEEEKQANEATELAALRLAEKIFDEYPNYRRYVIQNFNGQEVWKNKRLFNLARRSIIPTKSQVKANRWFGLNDITSYSGDGTVDSMFHDVFEGIEGTDQEKELCDSIRKNVEKKPDWLAGKVMLSMFDVRNDKEEQAKQVLTDLFTDEEVLDSVNGDTAWLIAQELEKFTETRDVAVKLLEKANKNANTNSNQIQYSATGKLIMLYLDSDDNEKARKLLLDASKKDSGQNYDQRYQMYQRGETTMWVARKLIEIDYAADAVSLMQGMLGNKEMLDAWADYGGNQVAVANQVYTLALEKALSDKSSEKVAEVAKTLIVVRENPRAGEGAFDLQVGLRGKDNSQRQQTSYVIQGGVRVPVYPNSAQEKPGVECKLLDLVDNLCEKELGRKLLNDRLEELRQAHPQDLSVAIAQTWFHLAQSKEESNDAAIGAVQSLLELVRQQPLDEIKEGRRPNSRQRRQAMQYVALWPISKKCLVDKDEKLKQLGNELSELAVLGSRRQSDKQYQYSMLFEWGDAAAQNDDKDVAEKKWSQLLEEVTRRPTRKSSKPKPQDTGFNALVPLRDAHSNSIFGISTSVALLTLPPQEAKGNGDKDESSKPVKMIPPLTNSQFQTALQIANAAADNDMTELSMRAMRELLKGGLPVADPQFANPNGTVSSTITYSSMGSRTTIQPGNATTAAGFGNQIQAILKVWERKEGYDPSDVYDLLVNRIFPPERAEEILLYEQSTNINGAKVSSLAQTLVEWAIKGERVDDLKKRIADRAKLPRAELSAKVLSGMLALETKDFAAAKKTLDELLVRISNKPVPRDISLVCHVAVPAYEADESLRVPCIEIYRKKLATDKATALGVIASRVNRYLAKNGGEEEVKKFFEGYLAAQQTQYANYGGDYGTYQVKNAMFRVASDLAKSNLVELALDYLGRAKDLKTSNYGNNFRPEYWVEIAKRVRAFPATERYETIRDWTLPRKNRQTLRFVSAWSPLDDAPLKDFQMPEVRDLPQSSLPGLQSNFLDLVDAAKEAGKLDELKVTVDAVDQKKHPAIETLKVCIAIKSGDLENAEKLVKEYIDGKRKRQLNKTLDANTAKWSDHLIYRLCMQGPTELSQLYSGKQNEIFSNNISGTSAVARREYARSRAKVLGANLQPGTIAPLSHWVPRTHQSYSNGKVDSWIVSDENQLMLLGAAEMTSLWLKYPLKGDFKFTCDVYAGQARSAEISFGGPLVRAQTRQNEKFVRVTAVSGHETINRQSKVKPKFEKYGKATIEVIGNQLKYSLNDKLIYSEELTGTYPWLILFSDSRGLTAWRNPVFETLPEILSEVPLVIGNRMEGWKAENGSQIPFRTNAEPKPQPVNGAISAKPKEMKPEDYDWYAKDSILYGKPNLKAKPGSDSILSYRRTLSDGESMSFEFMFESGKKMANPMIGSVVVSLANGRKVSELYAGDVELAEDSTIANIEDSPHAVEPVSLKQGEWNQAEIRIVGANAEAVVNGVLVWRRPIAKLDALYAGLQKFKNEAAEIRNLRLKGDWPSQFPEGLKENAFESKQSLGEMDRNLLAEVIGNRFISLELESLYADGSASDSERYERLRKFVMPGYGHGLRMNYRIVPREMNSTKDSSDYEPEIECPAWDLVVLAKENGKLEELSKSVDEIETPEDTESDKFRNVKTINALIAIANGDEAEVRKQIGELYTSIVEVEKKAKENKQNAKYDHVPVVVSTWFAAERPGLLDVASSLQKKCQNSIANLILERIDSKASVAANSPAIEPFQQWHQFATNAKLINSVGNPERWRKATEGLLQRSPGNDGPLYFQSPLTGKFEITADVSLQNGAQCWLDYGGHSVIARPKNHQFRIAGNSSNNPQTRKNVPRVQSLARYRIVVDESVLETYVNDVRVSRHEFKEAPQPWLTISTNGIGARPLIQNLRIDGQPVVPDEIDLLAADLPQWDASFFGGNLSRYKANTNQNNRYVSSYPFGYPGQYGSSPVLPNQNWIIKDGELTSGALTEASPESTLMDDSWIHYRRPMLEGGEFEFEMFTSEKKKKLCHPALGRSAFLFRKDGVYIHQIWAAGEDIVADSKIEGSGNVDLKNGEWNLVRVRLVDDEATIFLNDKEVAKLLIEDAPEFRYAGLFRFADQTNAQIRNIKYRGNWKTTVPPVEQQELALNSEQFFTNAITGSDTTIQLSEAVEKLNKAGVAIKGGELIDSSEQGLKISARKNSDSENWPAITKEISTTSDFDISLEFSDLRIANVTGWGCGLDLQVDFDDPGKTAVVVGVRREKNDDLIVIAQKEYLKPDGERAYEPVKLHEPFESGKLRLVRRGSKVYALAAEEGKRDRVITSFEIANQATQKVFAVGRSATDSSELDAVVKKMRIKIAE